MDSPQKDVIYLCIIISYANVGVNPRDLLYTVGYMLRDFNNNVSEISLKLLR